MSQSYFRQRQKREANNKWGGSSFWSTTTSLCSTCERIRQRIKLRPWWRDPRRIRAQKTLLCAILALTILYLGFHDPSTRTTSQSYSTSSLSIRSLSHTTAISGIHSGSEDILWTLIVPGHSRSIAVPQGEIDDNNNNKEEDNDNSLLPDYGGLVFVSLKGNKHTGPIEFQRHIRPDDHKQYEEEKGFEMKQMNDQEYISKRHWFDDEMEDEQDTMECRRPNWEKGHYPFCNVFHEVDLTRHYDQALAQRSGDSQEGDSFYLSHGYFRDVFSISYAGNNKASHSSSTSAVMKVARYTKHDINYRAMYNARRDALVMERLSGKDNIVDIYGHCGSSVMVESLPTEVEDAIVPDGWMAHEDLSDSHDLDVQNDFEVKEKLQIAKEMAESIAELHGFQDGVIVHDDIQLCQWLRNDKGKLKLGDFNRARVLHWNEEKQEYCKYNNGKGYGNYRSPEEYAENPLSQQHDVWSFGNNLYALLTGLWIFYENEDDEVVAGKVVNGSVAYIDQRYRTRSYIEGRLVDIMERCWVYDMDKRADIFEVVDHLRQTLKESEQKQQHTRR